MQVAELGVPYVLMHMRGDPTNMQQPHNTSYRNIVADVAAEMLTSAQHAEAAGIPAWSIILDPGMCACMQAGSAGYVYQPAACSPEL